MKSDVGTGPIGTCFWALARVLSVIAILCLASTTSHAFEILGTGAASLLGNDLTDIGDDGDEGMYAPPNLGGFDAEFFSSDEEGFGGGENAFNVFDNAVGGGNDKWCCGTAFPQNVGAQFTRPYFLTHFTVTSGNDTPDRDPRVWTLDGSNDGTNWTTIFTQDDPAAALWDDRLQVIRFDMGTDFPAQSTSFTRFRMSTTATNATAGAFFQFNELELFGETEPEGLPGDVNRDDVVDINDYEIIRDNFFTGTTRDLGDLNFNGLVDFGDFRIWKGAAFPAGGGPASVPEPGTMALLAIGLTFVGCGTRRRS